MVVDTLGPLCKQVTTISIDCCSIRGDMLASISRAWPKLTDMSVLVDEHDEFTSVPISEQKHQGQQHPSWAQFAQLTSLTRLCFQTDAYRFDGERTGHDLSYLSCLTNLAVLSLVGAGLDYHELCGLDKVSTHCTALKTLTITDCDARPPGRLVGSTSHDATTSSTLQAWPALEQVQLDFVSAALVASLQLQHAPHLQQVTNLDGHGSWGPCIYCEQCIDDVYAAVQSLAACHGNVDALELDFEDAPDYGACIQVLHELAPKLRRLRLVLSDDDVDDDDDNGDDECIPLTVEHVFQLAEALPNLESLACKFESTMDASSASLQAGLTLGCWPVLRHLYVHSFTASSTLTDAWFWVSAACAHGGPLCLHLVGLPEHVLSKVQAMIAMKPAAASGITVVRGE
jgi:hypothetical protein